MFMPKLLTRIVTFLLVPCLAGDALIPAGAATFGKQETALIADPVTASAFLFAAPISHIHPSCFEQEALQIPAEWTKHPERLPESGSPHLAAELRRQAEQESLQWEDSDFLRGYALWELDLKKTLGESTLRYTFNVISIPPRRRAREPRSVQINAEDLLELLPPMPPGSRIAVMANDPDHVRVSAEKSAGGIPVSVELLGWSDGSDWGIEIRSGNFEREFFTSYVKTLSEAERKELRAETLHGNLYTSTFVLNKIEPWARQRGARFLLCSYPFELARRCGFEFVGNSWRKDLGPPKRSAAAPENPNTPAWELLNTLGLLNVDNLSGAKLIETRTGPQQSTIRRIQLEEIVKPSQLSRGLPILQQELALTRVFDLLYNPRAELIGIFPVFQPNEGRRPSRPGYLDLSPYRFTVPRIGNKDAREQWEAFSQRWRSDQIIIRAYLNQPGVRPMISIGAAMHRKPYVFLAFDRKQTSGHGWEKYKSDSWAISFNPDELDTDWLRAVEGTDRLILPVFPSVYDPGMHWPDDQRYLCALHNGQPPDLHSGQDVLVVGPGSGIDAWLVWLHTGRKVYAVGINPFEVANTRAAARIAGFEIDARVGDNIITAGGTSVFHRRFHRIIWNMPCILSFSSSPHHPTTSFEDYHDNVGGDTVRRFARGLPSHLFSEGSAFVWSLLDREAEEIYIAAKLVPERIDHHLKGIYKIAPAAAQSFANEQELATRLVKTYGDRLWEFAPLPIETINLSQGHVSVVHFGGAGDVLHDGGALYCNYIILWDKSTKRGALIHSTDGILPENVDKVLEVALKHLGLTQVDATYFGKNVLALIVHLTEESFLGEQLPSLSKVIEKTFSQEIDRWGIPRLKTDVAQDWFLKPVIFLPSEGILLSVENKKILRVIDLSTLNKSQNVVSGGKENEPSVNRTPLKEGNQPTAKPGGGSGQSLKLGIYDGTDYRAHDSMPGGGLEAPRMWETERRLPFRLGLQADSGQTSGGDTSSQTPGQILEKAFRLSQKDQDVEAQILVRDLVESRTIEKGVDFLNAVHVVDDAFSTSAERAERVRLITMIQNQLKLNPSPILSWSLALSASNCILGMAAFMNTDHRAAEDFAEQALVIVRRIESLCSNSMHRSDWLYYLGNAHFLKAQLLLTSWEASANIKALDRATESLRTVVQSWRVETDRTGYFGIALSQLGIALVQPADAVNQHATLQQAREYIDEAQKLLPNQAEVLLAKGMLEARLGHWDEATKWLLRAWEKHHAPLVASELLACALGKNDLAMAQHWFDQIKSPLLVHLYQRGLIDFLKSDYPSALRFWEPLWVREELSVWLKRSRLDGFYANLIRALVRTGRSAEIPQLMTGALNNKRATDDELAVVLVEEGLGPQALEWLSVVTKEHHLKKPAHDLFDQIHERLKARGETSEATASVVSVMKSNVSRDWAAEWRKMSKKGLTSESLEKFFSPDWYKLSLEERARFFVQWINPAGFWGAEGFGQNIFLVRSFLENLKKIVTPELSVAVMDDQIATLTQWQTPLIEKMNNYSSERNALVRKKRVQELIAVRKLVETLIAEIGQARNVATARALYDDLVNREILSLRRAVHSQDTDPQHLGTAVLQLTDIRLRLDALARDHSRDLGAEFTSSISGMRSELDALQEQLAAKKQPHENEMHRIWDDLSALIPELGQMLDGKALAAISAKIAVFETEHTEKTWPHLLAKVRWALWGAQARVEDVERQRLAAIQAEEQREFAAALAEEQSKLAAAQAEIVHMSKGEFFEWFRIDFKLSQSAAGKLYLALQQGTDLALVLGIAKEVGRQFAPGTAQYIAVTERLARVAHIWSDDSRAARPMRQSA